MPCDLNAEVEWPLEKSGYLRRGRPVNRATMLGISTGYFGAATEATSGHFYPHALPRSGVALGCLKELIFKLLRLQIVGASTRTAVDSVSRARSADLRGKDVGSRGLVAMCVPPDYLTAGNEFVRSQGRTPADRSFQTSVTRCGAPPCNLN